MFRKPVKITEIEIEGQRYAARYYEQKTARGAIEGARRHFPPPASGLRRRR